MNAPPLRSTQKRGLIAILVMIAVCLLVSAWGNTDESTLDPDQFEAWVPFQRTLPQKFEINAGDTLDWKSLPGIGPVFAKRIMKYRNRIGGFSEVDQLKSVYGLSLETYDKILPFIYVDTCAKAYLDLKHKPRHRFPKKKKFNRPLVHIELNSADSVALRSVKGIGPVLAKRIEKYRHQRGGFDHPEDLLEVYGIKEGENYEQIAAQVFVDSSLKPEPRKTKWEGTPQKKEWKSTKYDAEPLNLNRADTTALIGIPGIGTKTAQRIVNFRNGLGFYHSVDQIKEVYGISEKNYLRMESYLFVREIESFPHLKINEWDVNRLARHPYVDIKLAHRIVAYRNEHGNFRSREDLNLLIGVKPATWDRLNIYLQF